MESNNLFYLFLFYLIIFLSGCTPYQSQEVLENCEEEQVQQIKAQLLTCHSKMDHKEIANILEKVRKNKVNCMALSEVLSAMLPHNADIYKNRDKWDMLRLRAYILLVLGEIGFPDSALPYLVDVLAYVDERMNVLEIGSSIRVVSQLKERGHLFKKYIISAFNSILSEEEFSLSTYTIELPMQDVTTIQLEVVKTLGEIGTSSDTEVIKFLNSVLAERTTIGYDRRVIAEAEIALKKVKERTSKVFFSNLFNTQKTDEEMLVAILNSNAIGKVVKAPSLSKEEVNSKWMENIDFINHDGNSQTLESIADKPLLITFFYTRCQNEGKCSATIAHIAELQYQLENFNLQHKVRLIAASYEPEFDTPKRLKRYALNRGVNLGSNAQAISFNIEDQQKVINQLNIAVGYNEGWVNSHAVEAFLVDVNGRMVGRYNSLLWEQSQIISDINKLMVFNY